MLGVNTTHTRPRTLHVAIGGAGLAGLAGWLNAVMLGIYHIPVSHMTGATARLGIDVASGNRADLALAASILGAFLAGAIVSGMIVGDGRLIPGRRYGVILLLVAAALAAAAAAAGLPEGWRWAVPLGAFAAGLQNAMASSWYGLVIRTTHVTGIVTDLGVLLGRRLRGLPVRGDNLALLATLWLAFFGGGVAGAVAHLRIGLQALWLAAGAAAIGGIVYTTWLRRRFALTD